MNPTQAVQRLLALPMTRAEIGAAVRADPSTIHRIGAGQEPSWALGDRLIALAHRRSRRNRNS